MLKLLASSVVMIAALAGCTSMRPVDVAKPSEVSVDAALSDVANGLRNFNSINKAGNTRYGLLVDEVTVQLKVTASAKDSSKLVIDVANVKPSLLSGGTLSSKFEQGAESSGNRDNTINVKLKNIYTASLNDAGKKRDGDFRDITILTVPRETYAASPLVSNQVIDCNAPNGRIESELCARFSSRPGARVGVTLQY